VPSVLTLAVRLQSFSFRVEIRENQTETVITANGSTEGANEKIAVLGNF
jgi:hypothetical protein